MLLTDGKLEGECDGIALSKGWGLLEGDWEGVELLNGLLEGAFEMALLGEVLVKVVVLIRPCVVSR
jgi:hypothetical protein